MTTLRDMPMISVEQKNAFREAAMKVEEERDALAGKMARMRNHAEYWINAAMPGPQASKQEYNTWLATGHHSPIMQADPAVFLARRDARMKAKALEELTSQPGMEHFTASRAVEALAAKYRKLAEGE